MGTTCGMPSGHSAYAVGLLCILMQDLVLPERHHRQMRAATLLVCLLPITWSRVQLGDHSMAQVVVGSLLGAITAGMWLTAVGPCCEAFLRAAIFRDATPRPQATEPVLDSSLLELSGPAATPAATCPE